MKKLLRWWVVLVFLLAAGLPFFEASRIGRRPSSVVKSSNPVTANKPDKVIEKKPPTNLNRLDPVTHVVHGVRELMKNTVMMSTRMIVIVTQNLNLMMIWPVAKLLHAGY